MGVWRKARDSRFTWPSLTLRFELLPWQWRLKPHGYFERTEPYTRQNPAGGAPELVAGGGLASFHWLFLEVDFWWNEPVFELE